MPTGPTSLQYSARVSPAQLSLDHNPATKKALRGLQRLVARAPEVEPEERRTVSRRVARRLSAATLAQRAASSHGSTRSTHLAPSSCSWPAPRQRSFRIVLTAREDEARTSAVKARCRIDREHVRDRREPLCSSSWPRRKQYREHFEPNRAARVRASGAPPCRHSPGRVLKAEQVGALALGVWMERGARAHLIWPRACGAGAEPPLSRVDMCPDTR